MRQRALSDRRGRFDTPARVGVDDRIRVDAGFATAPASSTLDAPPTAGGG